MAVLSRPTGDQGTDVHPAVPAHRGHVGAPRSFTDVEPDAYYATSVGWLTNFLVVPGCDLKLWCPNRAATRAEADLFINEVAIRPHILGEGNTGFLPQAQ